MDRKQLAAAIGISLAMVSKLAKRGMPVDSVERALRWRKSHLALARTKGNRAGTQRDVPVAIAPPAVKPLSFAACSSNDEIVQRVANLMQLAAIALRAGQLELVEADLRDALRRVPDPLRDRVTLDLEVMNALTRDVAVAMQSEPRDDAALAGQASVDDEEMGTFWYQVAAGEIVAS